jgi:heme/copper-type cytochrome/quinol oxidase subunit 2
MTSRVLTSTIWKLFFRPPKINKKTRLLSLLVARKSSVGKQKTILVMMMMMMMARRRRRKRKEKNQRPWAENNARCEIFFP